MMLVASLILLLLFVFPIWSITLQAPQYPNGITMYIWINKMTGDTPSTLQNINLLNHYVGMSRIEPCGFPELSYFPYIIIGLAATGLLSALINRPKVYLAWFLIIVILAVMGLYDFYHWEYIYGHNLNPEAPIKIEGMAYQPPLIGKKTLLNFTAYSWPALGAIMFGLSIIGGFVSWYWSRKIKKHLK